MSFWHIDGKELFFFIAKYIDIDDFLLFNFVVLLDRYWKFNVRIIKLIYVMSIISFNYLSILPLWMKNRMWHHLKQFSFSLFLMLINSFVECEFSWKWNIRGSFYWIVLYNVYPKTINRFDCPNRSFRNPNSYLIVYLFAGTF